MDQVLRKFSAPPEAQVGRTEGEDVRPAPPVGRQLDGDLGGVERVDEGPGLLLAPPLLLQHILRHMSGTAHHRAVRGGGDELHVVLRRPGPLRLRWNAGAPCGQTDTRLLIASEALKFNAKYLNKYSLPLNLQAECQTEPKPNIEAEPLFLLKPEQNRNRN